MGHADNDFLVIESCQVYLLALHPTEIDLGLDRVRVVFDKLNIHSPALKIIIGGTNGKGSTGAILEAILLASGYRVGVYSSPHLVHFNERFRMNGEAVDESLLCDDLVKGESERGEN